jgi:hypothetical protein
VGVLGCPASAPTCSVSRTLRPCSWWRDRCVLATVLTAKRRDRCRQSPSNIVVTNSRFTRPSAAGVGGMCSSGRPMPRRRLQCRVMLPALRQSRKRAPPSITFWMDAPHPNPDNRHCAALAGRSGLAPAPPFAILGSRHQPGADRWLPPLDSRAARPPRLPTWSGRGHG